ncbi:MAG: hypothetical protein KJO98_10630 [Rhodothermia bacterium]|nr:hypothetical protein [Rhodothermia bacterium]
MAEGYDVSRDESAWHDLDEFLCEYVDGSMDPVVREVFEEYVLQNPELAQHVECLCQARQLLRRSHCPCRLKADFLDRLRRRVSEDSFAEREMVMPGMYANLAHLTAFTSALLVMTMVGFMVGAYLTDPEPARVTNRVASTSIDRAASPRATFSSLFVAPDAKALRVGSTDRMTPVAPRRLPIVPIWADADWRDAPQIASSSVW